MENDKLAGCFGKIAITLLVGALGVFVGGWVLSEVWGWFIVPVFNAPSLTVIQAVGITFVVFLVLPGRPPPDTKDKDWMELFALGIAQSLVSPLVTWLLAYIVMRLM